MKTSKKSTCLCRQPFSVQKNKDLHTSNLFANLSLRKKKKSVNSVEKLGFNSKSVISFLILQHVTSFIHVIKILLISM